MKVLLVAEELPVRGDTGAFVYLRHFIDYCAARGTQLSILVTGHRSEQLFFRVQDLFPQPPPRVYGPGLLRLGWWYVSIHPRSWRHALFAWIVRRAPAPFASAALRLRGGLHRHTAIIGRWLGDAEARRLAATVRRLDPDVMLVNTVFAAAILEVKPARTRALVITHDVFHQRTRAFEERGLRVQPAVSEELEARLLRRFDGVIAISADDAVELARLAPHTPITVVPPPAKAGAVVTRRPHPRRCVFLGTGNALNTDGINWFLGAVWQPVAARVPDARLEVIGSVCNTMTVADPTVARRFFVDELGPVLAAASFAVNPLRAGSGVKIKMIDYFLHGVPAITTAVGAAGFPRNGAEPFVVCDGEAEFLACVLAWLSDPSLVERYAARCSTYVELFSRDSSFAALDRVIGPEQNAAATPDLLA